MAWEKDLDRWVEARLIDPLTAGRIREFEQTSGKPRLRWPAILAVSFGAVMLCAGDELWAEITLPRSGPPRPIQLAIKRGSQWAPLTYR